MSPARGCFLPVILLTLATERTAPAEPPAKGPAPRTDRHGDPLPAGALARMGTVRLRHGAWVFCAAFSPDGKALASGGDDHAFRLWQVATGRAVWCYRGQEEDIDAIAFSPDGRLVASGSADGTTHVLEAATGKALFRLGGATGRVTAVAFSPDGKVLASGKGYANGCTISLWEVATAKELRRLTDGAGTDFQIAFAPDGKTLASSRARRTVLWEVATGKVLREVKPGADTWDLAFSPDGKVLATAHADAAVRLWDAATGTEVRRLRGAGGRVAFSPDGKRLVTGGDDQTIRLWEAATGKLVRAFDRDTSFIRFIAFSPDGRTVASGCPGNRVRLWDAATGKQRRAFAGHQDAVTALTFSPGGRRLVTGGRDASSRLWDARTGEEIRRFAEDKGDGPPLVLSPDGRTLASGGSGEWVRLRDLATGRKVGRLGGGETGRGFSYPFDCLAFSPDGKVLASGSSAGTRLWDVARRKELRRLKVHGHSHALVFSADGKTLVALERGPATCEWRIHLRNAATGRTIRKFGPGQPPTIDFLMPVVAAIALSPDGQLLATAGSQPVPPEEPVRLWEVATGKERFALEAPQEPVECVAFSPDGRLLAAGDAGGVVCLWEVSTGKARRRFRGHQGPIRSLAFAPDGAALASGGSDSTALLWDLTGPVPAGRAPTAPRSARELERLWADLAGADAGRADEAIRKLIAAPAAAVALLRGRLRPVLRAAGRRIRRLIRQLDRDPFSERRRATQELEKFRDLAGPALREALAAEPSPEARGRLGWLLGKGGGRLSPGDLLGAVRAVEVLEHINTAEARQVLKALAEGAPEVRLTREAKAALQRLAGRPPAHASCGRAGSGPSRARSESASAGSGGRGQAAYPAALRARPGPTKGRPPGHWHPVRCPGQLPEAYHLQPRLR